MEANLEKKVKKHQAVLLKYPKNIRQVGEIGEGRRIYVEDYVMTLVLHLAAKARDAYSSAVLLGQKAMVEGRRTLFISGAVEIPQQWRQPEPITDLQWTAVYDEIQKYFQNVEVVGWFLTHPGMELEPDEAICNVWRSGFDGAGKVLFLYDNISREDAFYARKEGEFIRQTGYYIYYEKNEEMQNYIIDVKGGQSTDAGYQDDASRKIRQKLAKKKELQKSYLFHQQAVYTAGIVAGAAILVTAAAKLNQSTRENLAADSSENIETISKNNQWVTPGSVTEKGIETAAPETEETQEKDGAKDKAEPDKKQSTKKEKNKTEKETKKASSKKTEKKKRYKVKKGDTLESISIACYGTSSYVKKIKKLNQLENADKIYIGQKLILP